MIKYIKFHSDFEHISCVLPAQPKRSTLRTESTPKSIVLTQEDCLWGEPPSLSVASSKVHTTNHFLSAEKIVISMIFCQMLNILDTAN